MGKPLMPQQSEHFSNALNLYAGEADMGLTDIRGPLIDGMVTTPMEVVAALMTPGEIAAVLSSDVRIEATLACEEVFSLPPGEKLRRRLDELKQMLHFPLQAHPSTSAYAFVEKLSQWKGGELFQQVACVFFEKHLEALELAYRIN